MVYIQHVVRGISIHIRVVQAQLSKCGHYRTQPSGVCGIWAQYRTDRTPKPPLERAVITALSPLGCAGFGPNIQAMTVRYELP